MRYVPYTTYIVGDSPSHVRGALPEPISIIRIKIGVYHVIIGRRYDYTRNPPTTGCPQ